MINYNSSSKSGPVEVINYYNNDVKLLKKNNQYVWAKPIHDLTNSERYKLLYRVGAREPAARSGFLTSDEGYYADKYVISPGFYKKENNLLYFCEPQTVPTTTDCYDINEIMSMVRDITVSVPEFSVEPNYDSEDHYRGFNLNISVPTNNSKISISHIKIVESSFEVETIQVNSGTLFPRNSVTLTNLQSNNYDSYNALFNNGLTMNIYYNISVDNLFPNVSYWEGLVYEDDDTHSYYADIEDKNNYSGYETIQVTDSHTHSWETDSYSHTDTDHIDNLKCVTCGDTSSRTISNAVTTTSISDTQHISTCDECSYTSTVNHTFDTYNSTSEKCESCGYIRCKDGNHAKLCSPYDEYVHKVGCENPECMYSTTETHTITKQEGAPATCTDYGTTLNYCTICKDSYYTTNYNDPPTGHNYETYLSNNDWDPYDSDRTWCRVLKCTNCGHQYKTEDHVFDGTGQCYYCSAVQI